MKKEKKSPLRKFFKKGSGYEREQTLRTSLPWSVAALCRIIEVKPDELIHNFLQDLSHGSWKRHPDDALRKLMLDYFILRGYGRELYEEADIRKMFQETDAIGMLWPKTNKMKLIERHARWRDSYHDHWFKKWYYHVRRRKPE